MANEKLVVLIAFDSGFRRGYYLQPSACEANTLPLGHFWSIYHEFLDMRTLDRLIEVVVEYLNITYGRFITADNRFTIAALSQDLIAVSSAPYLINIYKCVIITKDK